MFDKIPLPDFYQFRVKIKEMFTNRLVIVGTIIGLLLCTLVYRLFVLQIVEGEEHQQNFNYKVERTIETAGARGNIYDCNGKLLAYNQLAYSITLESTDETKTLALQEGISENDLKNDIIYRLLQVLEKNGDEVSYNLPLELDSSGKLAFTENGSSLARFKKDIYGISNIDDLTGEEKQEAESWINSSPQEVYDYLRSGEGGPSGVGQMFGISDEYSVEDTLKIMSIRYDVYMNRYSQTTPITVASDVSSSTIAEISENQSEYTGVSIQSDSLRKYTDSKYFSSIIGYTAPASESELEELNENGGDYEANDVIGKTGIEKTMESVLRGKNGEEHVVVNNLGKVISTVNTTEAVPGENIYLTIDSDLQKYAYDILERRLAGILLQHLTTAKDVGSTKMISIYDVYFSLIDNNIVDITELSEESASTNEKEVYSIYQKTQKQVLSSLEQEMKSGSTKVKNLSEEKQEYVEYIYSYLKDENILDSSLVDQEDAKYIAWTNDNISLKSFLKHAISKEWIDISSFDIESDYYDADEIYDELIKNIISSLETDNDFDKILYKYMIKNEDLSGRRVCLLLYNQKVLSTKNDKEYKSLKNGKLSAYNFMYKKIQNLDITPAQLALDPCSGSVIITDPDTGDVKAMVSYPSYDNNRLANSTDNEYYARLNKDKSSPMLNRATQTRTAPGSTFKPISSTALLEEDVITEDTYVKCTGIFDKISPAAKCWIYPNAHGNLNVSGAIANSCNLFFYTGAYEMGTVNGSYNSATGVKTLRKYAKLYGLDRKSGVEITEYEPKISDEDAVRSAIGQGTHSYTPSQISRYVTSLVNMKSLLKLTLLDKATDTSGATVEDYSAETDGELEVSDHTFALIKKGMIDVVSGKNSSIKSLYKGLGLKVAGKTGTAQENKKRANHALFISYAPYDDPDITMTVVVPNGYASTNAAEIARDIYKYYFKKTTKTEEESTGALMPTGSDTSND